MSTITTMETIIRSKKRIQVFH